MTGTDNAETAPPGAAVVRVLLLFICWYPIFFLGFWLINPTEGLSQPYQFFPMLFAIGCSLLWIASAQIRTALAEPGFRRILWGLLALILYSSIVSILGPHPASALTRTAGLMLLLGFFLGLSGHGVGGAHFRFARRNILWALTVFSLLVMLFFLFLRGDHDWNWVMHAFLHIRHMGVFGLIALIAAITFYWESEPLPPWQKCLVLILPIFLITWSGTRGAAWIMVPLLFMASWVAPGPKSQNWGLIMLALVLGIGIAVLFDPFVNVLGFWRIIGLDDKTAAVLTVDQFSSGRFSLWQTNLESILQAPWTGYGPGLMPLVVENHVLVTQPHNVVLQVLLDWGMLGGVPVLFALLLWNLSALRSFLLAHRSRQQMRPEAVFAAILVLALSAYAFIDGTLFRWPELFWIAFAAALVILPSRRDEPSRAVNASMMTTRAFAIYGIMLLSISFFSALLFMRTDPEVADPLTLSVAKEWPVFEMLPGADLTYFGWIEASDDWEPARKASEMHWLSQHCRLPGCSRYYSLHAAILEGNTATATDLTARLEDATHVIYIEHWAQGGYGKAGDLK